LLESVTHHLPGWLRVLWVLLVPVLVWCLLPQQVIGGLRWLVRKLRARRSRGDARRAHRRGRFAGAMAARIADLSAKEDWQDDRFAELDAEVEVHGRQGRWPWRRRRETIRRVRSLSIALEQSPDPIILLEGEPGSGKSVAMRHLALRLAAEVRDRPSETGVIPIYVNLKEFRPAGPVDVAAVRTFVQETVNRANDHLIEKFMEDEFDRGIDEGTWIFLFDSFDEIPGVLGAVEADDLIESYATALYDFLTGMGRCRGIIATREFRGPRRIAWPRFRVLQLSDQQQHDLVQKLDLPLDTERRFLGELAAAEPSIRQLAENPLFLALLCEHQRDSREFPRSSHTVFEAYVGKRFASDDQRLQRRFGMPAAAVRRFAEQAAFTMAAEPGLGLSPTRAELLAGLRHQGYDIGERTAATALDALEYLRLARSVETPDAGRVGFTFSHRRFQEYFATCLVLREGSRVTPTGLLTDGRWRETAVTLMHTQSDTTIAPLLDEAERLLTAMGATVPGQPGEARSFEWPAGSLHLLNLLQAGLAHAGRRVPTGIRAAATRLLRAAYREGELHDRRWAVEVCLVADDETALELLRGAFSAGSAWLREAAYAQVGRLPVIPADLRQEMREVLAAMAAGGQLRRQRLAIDAQLRRLSDPAPERLLMKLFIAVPAVDAVLLTLVALCVLLSDLAALTPVVVVFLLLAHGALYVYRDTRRLDWELRYSTGRLRWLYLTVGAIARVDEPASMAAVAVMPRAMLFPFILPVVLLGDFGRTNVLPVLRCALLVFLLYVVAWALVAVRARPVLAEPTLSGIILLPFLSAGRGARFVAGALSYRLVLVFVVGLGVSALPPYLLRGFLSSFSMPDWLDVVVTFGLAAVMTSVPVVWMGRNMRARRHDRRLLRDVEAGRRRYDGFADMLATLGNFRTDYGLLLFVEHVKRHRVANDDDAALRAMRVFCEADQLSRRHDGNDDNPDAPVRFRTRLADDELPLVTEWAGRRLATKHPVGSAISDEIGRMVADVEIRRHTATPVPARLPRPAASPEDAAVPEHDRR
jgi:hypothetical protein